MPTVGGLTAWIAVNAFGSLLAGRSAPLDNVMPSNLTRIDRDEHDALLRARTFAMEIGQGQHTVSVTGQMPLRNIFLKSTGGYIKI